MSQSSILNEARSGADGKAASAGRGVLVLALATAIGIFFLQQLDDAPEITRASAGSANNQVATQAPPVNPVVSTAPIVQTRSPADVKVLVANGIGVSGVASKVAGRLQPIGYQLLKPGNTVKSETNSLVQYSAGYAAEAAAVANSLGLPASGVQALPVPNPVADLQGANIVVIVGNELANAPLTQSAQPQNGNVASGTTGSATQTGTETQTGQVGGVATTAVNPATNGPLSQFPGVTTTVPASGANNTNIQR